MLKKIIVLLSVSAISVLALSSYHSGAAASGYDCTGGESAGVGNFANPTGCTTGSCHGSAATSTVTVAIELDSAGVPTTHYKGGMTYTVKITGNNGTGTTLPKCGFQLACLKGTASTTSNADGGTWASTGLPATTHKVAPSTYTQLTVMEQSNVISVSGNSISESFSWTAPATGTGAVSFWGVFNFVNGNGGADAGDKFNNASLQVAEWPQSTSVANINNALTLQAYPNPCHNALTIQLPEANSNQEYSLSVFDLQGKLIQSTVINQNTELNTQNWIAGMYFISLSSANSHSVGTIIKQ
jgi:hypothetical protein